MRDVHDGANFTLVCKINDESAEVISMPSQDQPPPKIKDPPKPDQTPPIKEPPPKPVPNIVESAAILSPSLEMPRQGFKKNEIVVGQNWKRRI